MNDQPWWKSYLDKAVMLAVSALVAYLASRGIVTQQPTNVQIIQAPADPVAAAAFAAALSAPVPVTGGK